MAAKQLILALCAVWVVTDSWCKENRILCPKYCDCDLYEGLNRALCSEKKLISPYIEIPDTVEVLDLSYNDISALEDKCFETLKYLLNLTISNNAIHTIYLDAFYNLLNLQYVDLSHNRLEYFDPRIFENNLQLVGVNLNGNKFMSLSNEPFIISPSIQYLSLHSSQIMQTTDSQFTKMPLLTNLDLSDNLMITLNISTFVRMGELKHLNVLNNRWTTCENDLKSTVEYLRAKQVEVRINVCNNKIGAGGKMFEKMIMAPPDESNTVNETVIEVVFEKDVGSIWKNITDMNVIGNLECEAKNLETFCMLYETCNKKYSKLAAEQAINHYRTKWIDHSERVYVALYSGLFLGFFITSSVVYVIFLICGSRYCKKRRLQRKLTERRRRISACRNSPSHHIVSPRPLHPACPPSRPSTRPPPTRHAVTRANQRDFLLARLFERPERHRYNRPPQRLHSSSNSRACGSSSPQNLDTERLIRSSPTEEDTIASPIAMAVQEVPTIQIQIPDDLQDHSLGNSLDDITTIRVVDDEQAMEHLRAETPPPPYNEIVKE